MLTAFLNYVRLVSSSIDIGNQSPLIIMDKWSIML